MPKFFSFGVVFVLMVGGSLVGLGEGRGLDYRGEYLLPKESDYGLDDVTTYEWAISWWNAYYGDDYVPKPGERVPPKPKRSDRPEWNRDYSGSAPARSNGSGGGGGFPGKISISIFGFGNSSSPFAPPAPPKLTPFISPTVRSPQHIDALPIRSIWTPDGERIKLTNVRVDIGKSLIYLLNNREEWVHATITKNGVVYTKNGDGSFREFPNWGIARTSKIHLGWLYIDSKMEDDSTVLAFLKEDWPLPYPPLSNKGNESGVSHLVEGDMPDTGRGSELNLSIGSPNAWGVSPYSKYTRNRAVFGPNFGGIGVDLVSDFDVPAGILTMCFSDSRVTQLPDERLHGVYRGIKGTCAANYIGSDGSVREPFCMVMMQRAAPQDQTIPGDRHGRRQLQITPGSHGVEGGNNWLWNWFRMHFDESPIYGIHCELDIKHREHFTMGRFDKLLGRYFHAHLPSNVRYHD